MSFGHWEAIGSLFCLTTVVFAQLLNMTWTKVAETITLMSMGTSKNLRLAVNVPKGTHGGLVLLGGTHISRITHHANETNIEELSTSVFYSQGTWQFCCTGNG